jgi:pilus assembly protein CpaC
MRGLQLDFQDKQIQITGQLLRLSDWQTIHQLNLQEPYVFKAQLDLDVQPPAKLWIQNLIQSAGLPRAQIHWTPTAQITLPEEYRQQESQWRRVTDPLGLQIEFQKSELALEPLVRIHIFVAEINKSAKSQFGITWPDQAEAQLAPHFTGVKQLSIFLKGLEQKGLGQILASPNLLARSGGTAEFLAGGEFPIKIITPARREVVWKQHGISLKIKPKADRTGRLSVELSTEISIVDSSQAYEGMPGMKTNRMSTHFDLNQPQTIVLSGLIRHDWGQSGDGLKGLSQIPVLGQLFRSESFLNQKTELIIFVTPELVAEESSEKPQLPEGWKNYAAPD